MLTLTYNDQKIRCSTHYKPLAHQWYGYVASIDPVQVRSTKEYGGWLRVSLPTITFTPELFDLSSGKIATYPPPRQLPATIAGGVDELNAVELCRGVLSLKSIGEKGVEYEMYSSPYIPIPNETQVLAVQYSYDAASWHNSYQATDRYLRSSMDGGSTWGSAVQFIVPGSTFLASWGTTATLIGFFTKVCSCLGLTLDSTLAAAPVITGTVASNTLVLDVADAVAAYFCHYFYISSGVLHLLDAASINGSAYSFGLWDYIRQPKYTYQPPVNTVVDESGKIFIQGNTLFGRSVSAGVSYYAADSTYLQKISAYSDLVKIEFSAMDFYGEFVPGRQLTWIDDRHVQTLHGSMMMRAAQYTFGVSGDRVTVLGEATLTL